MNSGQLFYGANVINFRKPVKFLMRIMQTGKIFTQKFIVMFRVKYSS